MEEIFIWTFVLLGQILFSASDPPRGKEFEEVITGSKYSGGTGTITAPPTHPIHRYKRDATSYIFILENVAIEGSVELVIDDFNIHPDSWITIRNSKYGGYIGEMIGRFDQRNRPPGVVFTDTCCLRVEFQTGCCSAGTEGFTGFSAKYRFVETPVKGRRSDCTSNMFRSQLCNGECIPNTYECPCAKYGQFKCDDGICIMREAVCDGIQDCQDDSDEKLCFAGWLLFRPHREGGPF